MQKTLSEERQLFRQYQISKGGARKIPHGIHDVSAHASYARENENPRSHYGTELHMGSHAEVKPKIVMHGATRSDSNTQFMDEVKEGETSFLLFLETLRGG